MQHSSMPGARRIRLSSIEGEKKGIQCFDYGRGIVAFIRRFGGNQGLDEGV